MLRDGDQDSRNTFLDALDRFEDVARWVTDHATEAIPEADIPVLHQTMSLTPEEIANAPKKTLAEALATVEAAADELLENGIEATT